MPHALTDRQKEVLLFIRNYISRNESAPRLEEIAEYFGVKAPTADKYLKALQQKGYLYFGRTKSSGFFIRLIERASSAEMVVEIVVAGWFNLYGEVLDFPTEYSHFASLLQGVNPENLFALIARDDIPEANIQAQDIIIFDQGKTPKPGDICIGPIGKRLFLIRIGSRTYDRQIVSDEMDQQYQIPDSLVSDISGHMINWHPLAYNEANREFFVNVANEDDGMPEGPMLPEFIVATALRLTRSLAF